MKQPARSQMMALVAGVALCFCTIFSFSFAAVASPVAPSWTDLARKVGSSEDERVSSIKELKKIPNLASKLRRAIYSTERPLALDVISALDLKEMIPDLLLHVPADPDGFLTVAVNSMMNESNQTQILNSYADSLQPKNLSRVSPGAVVAMLEPLGRLSIRLPRLTLQGLRDHSSPEVRSSTLYYLRIMSLRNKVSDHLDLVSELTRAGEFQIRLQAVSVSAEILAKASASPAPTSIAGLLTKDELRAVCAVEKQKQVKSACLSFLSSDKSVTK